MVESAELYGFIRLSARIKTWESPTPPCALLIFWACSDSSKSRGWMNMFDFATLTHTYHLSLNLGSENSLQKQKQKQQKAHRKLLPRCTSRWHVCDMSGIQKWQDLCDAVTARELMAQKTGGRMKIFFHARETRSHAIVWHFWSFIKTKFHLRSCTHPLHQLNWYQAKHFLYLLLRACWNAVSNFMASFATLRVRHRRSCAMISDKGTWSSSGHGHRHKGQPKRLRVSCVMISRATSLDLHWTGPSQT